MPGKMILSVVLFCIYCVTTGATANMLVAKQAIQDKSYSLAEQELTKLAELGSAEAQYLLGLLYYKDEAGFGDKQAAFSWLFLAAEYNYPDAAQFARQIFDEEPKEQQEQVKKSAFEKTKTFGRDALQAKLYPVIELNRPASIVQVASEKKRFEYRSDDLIFTDSRARGNNLRVQQTALLISRLNKGYRHNAYDNLDKLELEQDSGLVIVKHAISTRGKVEDPEVIFSWPQQRFDYAAKKMLDKSEYTAALNAENKPIVQYGVVSERRIGFIGKNIFRDKYPEKYEYLIRIRKKALKENNADAKYLYSIMLRAYEDILATKQPTTYQELLKELSMQGYVAAQFDYAQYLIYEAQDVEQGLEWLVEAAKTGHIEAQYRLGDMLLHPPTHVLIKDKVKAKFWLERAAQHGSAIAKSKLTRFF